MATTVKIIENLPTFKFIDSDHLGMIKLLIEKVQDSVSSSMNHHDYVNQLTRIESEVDKLVQEAFEQGIRYERNKKPWKGHSS